MWNKIVFLTAFTHLRINPFTCNFAALGFNMSYKNLEI